MSVAAGKTMRSAFWKLEDCGVQEREDGRMRNKSFFRCSSNNEINSLIWSDLAGKDEVSEGSFVFL